MGHKMIATNKGSAFIWVFKGYLGKGSAMFFGKVPDGEYFRICGPDALCRAKAAVDNR